MLNTILKQSINNALNLAKLNHHEVISLEHLLLALLHNSEVKHILMQHDVDVEYINTQLRQHIVQHTPFSSHYFSDRITYSLPLQRVLQRAQEQTNDDSIDNITWVDVISAILSESHSFSALLLQKAHINFQKIKNIYEKTQGPYLKPDVESSPYSSSFSKRSLLDKYAENISNRGNDADFLIGRDHELTQIIKVLCQYRKNNPLLVGEIGVGKGAIVKGLAKSIASGQVPEKLANATLYSLDLGLIFVNLKHREEMEERFKSIVDELSQKNNAIIFIDNVHELISGGDSTDLLAEKNNFIKLLLSQKKIRCIGSTSYEDYRAMLSKHSQLLRRFHKIDVQEPRDDETMLILQGIKSKYEMYHEVEYSDEALRRTIELSRRYITDSYLPEKAIDILDEAGAYQELNLKGEGKKIITPYEIEEIISKKLNIPLSSLSTTERSQLKNLAERLKSVVYGQDEAIDLLCNSIQLAKFGLRDSQKPIGSFLLAGPTGVGKTEISKQLAKMLHIEFIRFDMSEYMEKHAVAKLIGAPPGYVGFEQGGLLTEAINKHPHSVLLLDEIEKAHPEIFNLLLQVMDYGCLTDSNGRKADFHHVMIIMTTNAGAQQLERPGIGFAPKSTDTDSTGEISQLFSPEFRNRLDGIVHFKYLERDSIVYIVNKQLSELKKFLSEKNISLNLTPAAENWIAEKGYNRTMGARPLELLIKNKIKIPLSVEMLYGKLENHHGTVDIDVKDDDLQIQFNLLDFE